MSNKPPAAEYPFSLTSYCSGLDDGHFCQRELKEESRSWRSEKYAPVSSVLILDHHHGVGTTRVYDDAGIDRLINADHDPQVRIILLQPTPQEQVLRTIRNPEVVKSLLTNELINDQTIPPANEKPLDQRGEEVPSQLNITRHSLLKILTRYDIAPAASSHIRGQEQIFGSRQLRDSDGAVKSFEFWYAIRARAYVRKLGKEADLKMTIVTRYNAQSDTTLVLLKYRSFNDLPQRLLEELVENLEAFIKEPNTASLAKNPFILSIIHFNPTIQYYRRAARDPRDTIREEERRVHGGLEEFARIDLNKLHLTLTSLDQDKIQMNFILGVIGRLRKQHEAFQAMVKGSKSLDQRDWLYFRVEEEFDRFENQMAYFKSSVEDVARRVERLLDLLFNMSSRINTQSSSRMTRYAMQESASMSTISVVTMLFLPGTFIATILGTNIITGPTRADGNSPGDSKLLVSSQWWVLVVLTVSLTILTMGGWYILQRRTRKSIARISNQNAV
ncbi:hypothetical protein P175DRAFT_0501480 [Aspergillus ochraceoroseus IBT 24754]|uniref:Uncharacterized protein n=2 Tax=Aspergillus ochraceoroseus TaxID=138278 RepID=A0A2T5LX33_9EURO|nr:uncharacterized protein P175DRAFT_0501480 [Aspergillus ochraceoroseus IBT 24754]KKK12447.1 hypothetical protein AOCH_000433 [Aspergillus ochraceoroseus]PTU20841.1 hypothetical protein P175DRAFT_0501480 [Aspergillus ochraceoroseus IBT 24754]